MTTEHTEAPTPIRDDDFVRITYSYYEDILVKAQAHDELVAHLKFAVALLALIPPFGASAQVEAMRATLAKVAA